MKKFMSILAALSLMSAGFAEEITEEQPVVILGGGVGALTSATYLARAGAHPLVLTGPLPGGALVQSHSVQNWPGEMAISGIDLIDKMQAQAQTNGATLRSESVTHVDFSQNPFVITTVDPWTKQRKTIRTKSCIIALGSYPNLLNVPGEKTYWSKGVYSCAVCDGSLYKDKVVAIVGGGDSAVTEAHYLANIAKKVYIIVRKNHFRASDEQRKNELLSRPNIEILFNHTVQEVVGDEQKVTALRLTQDGSEQKNLNVDALFLAIGATPNTELFKGQLNLDNRGYIVLKNQQETSIPGVYAIGDVVDPEFKQAVTAAGDGAKAALQVQKRLNAFSSAKNVADQTAPTTGEQISFVSSYDELQNEIRSAGGKPVFAYFFSKTCPPCRAFGPTYQEWASQYSGKIRFLKVDTRESGALVRQFGISGIPTLIIFDQNGDEVRRSTGGGELSDVGQQLDKLKSRSRISASDLR